MEKFKLLVIDKSFHTIEDLLLIFLKIVHPINQWANRYVSHKFHEGKVFFSEIRTFCLKN
jgi:hypothetical protein